MYQIIAHFMYIKALYLTYINIRKMEYILLCNSCNKSLNICYENCFYFTDDSSMPSRSLDFKKFKL